MSMSRSMEEVCMRDGDRGSLYLGLWWRKSVSETVMEEVWMRDCDEKGLCLRL